MHVIMLSNNTVALFAFAGQSSKHRRSATYATSAGGGGTGYGRREIQSALRGRTGNYWEALNSGEAQRQAGEKARVLPGGRATTGAAASGRDVLPVGCSSMNMMQ